MVGPEVDEGRGERGGGVGGDGGAGDCVKRRRHGAVAGDGGGGGRARVVGGERLRLGRWVGLYVAKRMPQPFIQRIRQVHGDVVPPPGNFSGVSGEAEIQSSDSVAHFSKNPDQKIQTFNQKNNFYS